LQVFPTSSNPSTCPSTVRSPPQIIRQSARRTYYNDAESPGRSIVPVSIECEASGTPQPEYRWTKNEKPLVWQSNPRYSLDPESGGLLIEDPEMADNGWYQCIAYNSLGVAKSDPIYFFNASRIEFNNTNTQPSITLTAEEGRPFQMSCPNATADPAPEITWVIAAPPKDGKTEMKFFSSNRTVVGPDGTAYFTHVVADDDSEVSGRVYMCMGVNEALPNDYSIGVTVSLKVSSFSLQRERLGECN